MVEGGGELGQDGEATGEPASGLVDQTAGGLEIEGERDVRLVRGRGRAGGGQQVAVDRAGEVGRLVAVLVPVAVERVTGVGHRALQDLDTGDVPRARQSRQRAPPACDVAGLGARIEQRKGTRGDLHHRGERAVVRIVHRTETTVRAVTTRRDAAVPGRCSRPSRRGRVDGRASQTNWSRKRRSA